MATKSIKSNSYYDLRSHYCPDVEEREVGVTNSQRQRLTDYINLLHNEDEDEKEQKLSQLDEMTETEAAEMLSEVPW